MILLNQRHNYDPNFGSGLGQYGSRTDSIEMGPRPRGGIDTFISSAGDGGLRTFEASSPTETKDFSDGGEYRSKVSFRVPGIKVSKTVITT